MFGTKKLEWCGRSVTVWSVPVMFLSERNGCIVGADLLRPEDGITSSKQ